MESSSTRPNDPAVQGPVTPVAWRESLLLAARRLLVDPWPDLLSLTLVVLLTYWGLWHSYFHSDDFWMLGWVRFPSNAWEAFTVEARLGYAVRPVEDWQIWLRMRLFGLEAAPHFWISLAQHLAVTALTYWLARLLHLSRLTAWLGALLFATSFSAFWVVHWITGSNISLSCMFGLLALCLFILFRRSGQRLLLLPWLACIGVMLFTNEHSFTLLPMFVLYDLFVALPGLRVRAKIDKLLVHLCYLLWLIPYALLHLHFVASGTSEYGDLALRPDILMNYGYLFYLALPYVPGGFMTAWPSQYLPSDWATILSVVAMLLAAMLLLAAVISLWRGTRVQRYLVVWIVVSFFPFTLWSFSSGLSAAARYRYVPAMAFSLLVASALAAWWHHDRAMGNRRRWLVPALVVGVLVSNLAFHQITNAFQVHRGEIKREVVELLVGLPTPPEGSEVILEIPNEDFEDLNRVCELVYVAPIKCAAVYPGQDPPLEALGTRYWIKVGQAGVQANEDWR